MSDSNNDNNNIIILYNQALHIKNFLEKKNIFFLQSSLTPDYNYEESIKRTKYVRVALSKNA